MPDDVVTALKEVLALWEQMKRSSSEDAGDDADRFQMKFYDFVNFLKPWIADMEDAPQDSDAAREDPRFRSLFEELPEMLQIPFESELDVLLEGQERDIDSTEQS